MDHLPDRAARFAEALELFCGAKPPPDLAARWLAGADALGGLDSARAFGLIVTVTQLMIEAWNAGRERLSEEIRDII